MEIAWTPTSRRALLRLTEKVASAVIELIYGPLADNPGRVDKPLRFDLDGLQSARRRDFRLIYRIDETVRITAIEHRADVYRSRLPRVRSP
ncbi:MAG: type II toxin-antitoxin system RelE family toxin [Candidatus Nanopelagicales bacterium]